MTRFLLYPLIGFFFLAVQIIAFAEPPQVIEEVTVTAQKREQNLQDVGISVTAFSGDLLQELGYINTTDIAAQTPGFNITQFHPTLTNVNIRGVSQNDFAEHLEPPIAMYVDGAYVSSMGAAHVQMFDVERVEVLRGPQGTLFGRNATGGLVHYISRRPGEEFSGYGELTLGEYNQIKFEGAVSGPFSDRVSGRLSVARNKHDGYIKTPLGDLRETDSISIRGQLQFDISDNVNLWLKLHYSEDDSNGNTYDSFASTFDLENSFLGTPIGADELGVFFDFIGGAFTTCPGCNAYGFKQPDDDPHTAVIDEVGMFKREITGATGRLEWDIGEQTLTAISDYLTMDKLFREDTDGTPSPSAHFLSDHELEQFSQELLLNGGQDKLDWLLGLYYLDIDTDNLSGFESFDLGPFIGFPGYYVPLETFQQSEIDTQSWAVFGHFEYSFSPEWKFTGALRYTEDKREMDFVLFDSFGTYQEFNPSLYPNLAKQKYSNVSAKAQVDWTPNDDLLMYASYTRGHKAGNFSAPYIGPVEDFSLLPHDEEVLDSYEIGFKKTFAGGRGRLNASAFYYDYNDYQASFFVEFVQTIANLDAKSYGAEIELVFSPTERFDLMLGMALLDTEVMDVGMPDGSIQDRELPFAPPVTFNGLARYTWPVFGGFLTLQGDFNYSDAFCFTVMCNVTEEEGSYVVGNARLSFTTGSDNWTVAAFVRNIGDENYNVYGFDSSFVGGSLRVAAPPRWYGVTATYRW